MHKHKQGMTVRRGGHAGAPCRSTVVLLMVFSCLAGIRPIYGELIWSRFVGGSDYDYALGVAVDSQGNTIIAGDTRSSVFYGAATPAAADAFVVSLDAEGGLRWAVCIGGRGGDSALNLAVDAADNILITGLTTSDDMPARTNAYNGGTDAFAAKLDADGNLLWTTYLGGAAADQGFGIAVDPAGNAVIAGYTESKDFQHRRNSFQGGSFDGFAAAVSVDGMVQWVSYIGWTGSDYCAAAAVDAAGDYLVAGTSSSATLPQAINSRYGADDAFIALFSPDGVLQQSRFLGGARADRGCDVAVSRWGQILVAGETESTDFVGAKNASHGQKDAFVSILDAIDADVHTTYFGGSAIDVAWALAEDSLGSVVLAGSTYSTALVSSDNQYGTGQEAFLAAFSATGTLLFSSYLGGGRDDCAFGLAIDGADRILVAGSSSSVNFIGAVQYNGGSRDGFVAKLAGVRGTSPDLVVTHALKEISGLAGEQASVPVQVENTGAVDAIAYGPGYFSTALYLTETADADWNNLSSQNAAAAFSLAVLDAAGVHEAVMTIDVPEEPGTYYLRVRTDDADSVPEEREYNNWGQVITLTVSKPAGRPDLIVIEPAEQMLSVIRNSTLTVDVEIKNIGQSDAVAAGAQHFTTRLYLAEDPDADWNSLASTLQPVNRAVLAAGASYATNVAFPAGIDEGTHYLRARVDENDAVDEATEENNWGPIVTLTVMEAPALADLTIPGEDGMAVSGTTDHAVYFVADVQNIGDANAVAAGPAPIQAAVYLANYAGVNWDTLSNKNRLATADLLHLAAGETGLLKFAFDAPGKQGAYCLRAKIDTANAVEEVSENNNWGPIVPFTVDANSLPDIVASFADANDLTRRPLENVTVTVDVANAGPGPADPSPASYFETLLYFTSAATDDANSIGFLQTGVLEPYEVQAGTLSFSAPAMRGAYYLHARTDIADHIRESNEYNNVTPRVTLIVDGPPLDNEPPVLIAIEPKTVAEGQTLTFTVAATDPEGDPLDYFAVSRPNGATFVDSVFTWTPDYDQQGEYKVMFYVSDGQSSDYGMVDITVTNTNRPPVITLPQAIVVDEIQIAVFTVGATDPDGDTLVSTADNLPAGATFADGRFAWTPTHGQAGEYVIRFVVRDGHVQNGETTGTVIVTVNDMNRPPVAHAGADRVVVVADADGDGVEAVLLDGTASEDADGDALTYRWTNAGGNVLAADAAPVITFAVGVHVVMLTVTDSHGSSHADTVSIEVQRVNRPPIARAGENLACLDRDGDGLEWITLNGSASSDADGTITAWRWMLQDTVIGSKAVQQIPLPIGTFTIRLHVTDDSGDSDEDTLTVVVAARPANRPPVIAPIEPRTIGENQKLTFSVTADDPEGREVALVASNLPANATFSGGVFTFRPWYDQSGVHTITFTASDGLLQTAATATVTVEEAPLTDWYRTWLQKMQR